MSSQHNKNNRSGANNNSNSNSLSIVIVTKELVTNVTNTIDNRQSTTDKVWSWLEDHYNKYHNNQLNEINTKLYHKFDNMNDIWKDTI